jgi:hypothetical protein
VVHSGIRPRFWLRGNGGAGYVRMSGKAFFFEKKKQKTFTSYAGHVPYRATAQELKVFWFFSSEKNMLSSKTEFS